MNRQKKKGFTLVELVVVLVIMTIILGIAIPSVLHYMKMAEFRKNEENAKTVYLAAESKLTYYRNSGQWENFKTKVLSEGQQVPFTDSDLQGKIYGITLNKERDQQATAQNNAVLELLDGYTYDKGMLDASIAIEIDIESGEVYSAFYGNRCKGLNYESEDAGGYLTMMKRDYDSRKDRVLGYYSVEDTVHVVALKPTRLKITSISLLNSETLSLNWSSNMGSDLDVEYDLEFYQKASKSTDEDTLLFTMTVDPRKLREQGWNVSNSSTRNMVPVEVKDASGTSKGNWYFPITIQDGKYVLTLDAMMSAEVMAALDGAGTNRSALEQTSSTSICRLKTIAASLSDPQNIYAGIQAVAGSKTTQEYRSSEKVTSNTANTMFADDSKTGKETVMYYRHLSNLRYYHKDTAAFTLTNRNMDWTAVGAGLYEFATEKSSDGDGLKKLVWHGNDKKEVTDFPTIETLPEGYTLTGKGKSTKITNLRLGEDSVIKDSVAEKLSGVDAVSWIGLFGEIEGTVSKVTFEDPLLELTADAETEDLSKNPVNDHDALKGAGILAGRCEGDLKEIQILATKDTGDIVKVSLGGSREVAGVGGVVGVLAQENKAGKLTALKAVTISGISVEGKIQGALPEKKNQEAKDCASGIGGVAGYAYLDNQKATTDTVLKNCENHADLYGNYATGGIVGNLHGAYKKNSLTQEEIRAQANISACSSDGLIQATTDAVDGTMTGKYFGGIVGYGYQALLYDASSASGRAGKFSYDASKKNLLKGDYVGGIVGYGEDILLSNCSTKKKGYVLGADYVGGIAGGLDGEIRAGGEVLVTTNASYVIGNSYVGGIVGKNTGEVTIQNCINNGVAAGYDCYIGGITGYNDATIEDCASYLSDYSSSIFKMIVSTWNATGDFAGGITGYNNGTIKFSASSEKVTVKSVSSIVVGNNYVGGIAGFNDVSGTLDVHYTLIGGRIHAYGDCAGGGIGFNASENLLTQELTIKPSSVQGRYYVGGCIGANVVNLTKNITMDGFRADNRLGSVTGEAYVGGIIGYQRTYTAAQFGGSTGAIADAVAQNAADILPGLKENNTPGDVIISANSRTLTITEADNGGTSLKTAGNNISLKGYLYVGGIVGFCESGSRMELKNCLNTGNIGTPADGTYTDSQAKDGVNLAEFAAAQIDNRSLSQEAGNITLHPSGGIIGVNLADQTITNCENTGTITGYNGIGGIVGLNAGTVESCNLTDNFGSASLSYIGGISGINMGTVQNCTTKKGKTVSGKTCVGGITGWNLNGGTVQESTSASNVTGDGDNIGGISGRNSGTLQLKDESSNSPSRTIRGKENVGGITGRNESAGVIRITASKGEQVAAGDGLTVNGTRQVGGIIGYNQGNLQGTATAMLVSKANRVRATQGIAGGIAGASEGKIAYAANRSGSVQADEGEAGGIVGINQAGQVILNCINYGDVTSSDGYAGGIAAVNNGSISDCQVKAATKTGTVKIHSVGVKESGAICGVNTGVISRGTDNTAMVDSSVTLSGNATIYGGIAGSNQKGTITGVTVNEMPVIDSRQNNLTVGGVAGKNEGWINSATVSLTINNFSNYRYLGGIAGENKAGTIGNCTFTGRIVEKSGSAGNCYGGITGLNEATVSSCQIGKIYLKINGVYTATSTSTAEQKEKMATHAGGVAGKNETGAVITGCTIENHADSELIANYGMLGGITGYNKGSVRLSGTVEVQKVYSGVTTVEQLDQQARQSGAVSVDTSYIRWDGNKSNALENVVYNATGTTVSAKRMKLYMDKNGNLGGIVAFNSTQGSVDQCMSGNWFLSNKSSALGVGTGGIIGMNKSEKDMSGLVNGAFVGRQLTSAETDRFAGGIIGNQNNSTSSNWVLENCINYGTVYCYNTHYSGGIMGQWTGSGGTIQNCRNYGLLQTTISSGWYGASAGIVAQLYHAYEGNTYNIIGCSNYGSIYTRNGADIYGQGANDSAGILGNITNYNVSNAADAQSYTVQILDCANEPGVEIYSSSMASGIFGFLSSDDADQPSGWDSVAIIQRSTCQTKIRVERCRNFGSVLKGKNFSAGIFGDRYGTTGWENTVVNDCYGVHLSTGNYYGTTGSNNYPIFGAGTNIISVKSNAIKEENRKNNYYIENTLDWSYTDVEIGEDAVAGNGSGAAGSAYNKAGLSERYITNLYVMYDITKGQYFLAVINPKFTGRVTNGDYQRQDGNDVVTVVKGKNHYIDTDDNFIKASDGAKLAKVITYLDMSPTEVDKYLSISGFNANGIQVPDNGVFQATRESWRHLEGIDENNQMLQPDKVQATIADGKITMQITPQERSDKDLDLNEDSQLYDPFMYEVEITGNGKTVVQKIYSENETFTLPSGMSGKVSLRVRAVSMFEDVKPSEWYTVSQSDINKILPDPDVEIHLIEDASEPNRGYNYEYSLKNLDEYEQIDETTGEKVYPNWQVTVTVQGLGKIVLDADNPTRTLQANNENSPIYQMVAKASSKDKDGGLMQDSKEISTPIYIPYYYRPQIALNTWNDQVMTTSWKVTGDTLDNLSVEVTLNAEKAGAMNTPPIYRVELVGNWNGQDDVVFAKEDVLIVSKGTVSATFSGLPSYLADAKDVRLRIWYAASGLGPVYTYYPLEEGDKDINVRELENVDENGQEQWSYSHSTVLSDYSKTFYRRGESVAYFVPYIYDSEGALWTWLPAPVLDGADSDTMLTPEITSDGKIYYTFTWDTGVSGTQNASYQVSLTGIDEKDREVTIDVSDAYTGGKSLRLDATDWNYTSVKLKVTRIGDEKTRQIGLSTTGTYKIRQRLEAPGQPSVENMDVNELDYQLTWAPISSENGCSGYQAYIQVYGDDNQLEEAKTLGDFVKAGDTTDGVYKERLMLDESYAGKTVVVYIVAKADPSGSYLDSEAGVTYQLTIPERLETPKADWSVNWTYSKDQPVEAEDFRNGGLEVSLKNATVPPGGSAYLLKGYVYDSASAAKAATSSGNPEQGAIATYPETVDGILTPVEMDMDRANAYHHDLEDFSIKYAGKYMVFYSRISSGGGNLSSLWIHSDSYQLPYVKLEQPEITSDGRSTTITAYTSSNPDLPQTAQTWNVTNTVLQWNSVECADTYQMNLQGTVQVAEGNNILTKQLSSKIRVMENYKNRLLTVQQQDTDGNWMATPVTETREEIATSDPQKPRVIYHYTLDSYQTIIESSYLSQGVRTYYTVTLAAELTAEQLDDGTFAYTLVLPDVEAMDDGAGTSITNANFSITNKAIVEANVVSNIWPTDLNGDTKDNPDQKPEEKPYIKSDPVEITFQ